MSPAPSTRPSIRIVKSMPWRGGTRTFSNRYHFTGPTPDTSGKWATLAGNVKDLEKLMFCSDVTIIEAVGYDAGSEMPVYSTTFSQAGTFSTTGVDSVPGECAALLRWTTDARTSRNHPIYLFNYFHGIRKHTGNAGDTIDTDMKAAVKAYAGDNWDPSHGVSDGSDIHHRCGPYGAVGLVATCETYFTHRDFPR